MTDTIDMSNKRFQVSLHEIREVLVRQEEFVGRYVKTVTLSNGATLTLELTPTVRDGEPLVELRVGKHRSYMGLIPVRTGINLSGQLMIHISDADDIDAARAEWRKRHLSKSPMLPPDTSLLTIPELIPPGFTQGIEVLNDNVTPMKFVQDALSDHAGLSPADANQTTLAIHKRGGALIPTPSVDDAQRIASQITAEAAKHGYPLICRAVKIGA